jgi:hypothetical protein
LSVGEANGVIKEQRSHHPPDTFLFFYLLFTMAPSAAVGEVLLVAPPVEDGVPEATGTHQYRSNRTGMNYETYRKMAEANKAAIKWHLAHRIGLLPVTNNSYSKRGGRGGGGFCLGSLARTTRPISPTNREAVRNLVLHRRRQ